MVNIVYLLWASRRSRVLVCITLALSILTRDAHGTETADQQAILLDALRQARATTNRLALAGEGTAKYERSEELIALNKNRSIPKHKVDFKFSEAVSLTHEWDPASPTHLYESRLITASTIVDYFATKPSIPESVLITSARRKMFSADIEGWSFRDFSRIPLLVTEERFFSLIQKVPALKVSSNGHLVNLAWQEKVPPNGDDNYGRYEMVFDMSLGGMLIHYQLKYNGPEEVEVVIDTIWKQGPSGAIVPVRREGKQTDRHAEKLIQQLHSVVDVEQFSVQSVDAAHLGMDDMNIPIGTRVVDDARGVQWKYFTGAGAIREREAKAAGSK